MQTENIDFEEWKRKEIKFINISTILYLIFITFLYLIIIFTKDYYVYYLIILLLSFLMLKYILSETLKFNQKYRDLILEVIAENKILKEDKRILFKKIKFSEK